MTHPHTAAVRGAAIAAKDGTPSLTSTGGGDIPGSFPRKVGEQYAIGESYVAGETARWRDLPGAAMTIAQARHAYDAGTHTLCQGRDPASGRMILYAVPLKTRAAILDIHRFHRERPWLR